MLISSPILMISLTSLLLAILLEGSLLSISSHSYCYYYYSPLPYHHHRHHNRLLIERKIMPSSSAFQPSSLSPSSSQSSSGGDSNNKSKKKKKDITYNFARGHPNYVPTKEMKDLMKRVIVADAADTAADNDDDNDDNLLLSRSLTYLPNDRGQPELLKELGNFLERHTKNDDLGNGNTGDPGGNGDNLRLFITNGVSHGLDLLCATQTQPGDLVLVERPSYFLAYDIFKSHHLNVEGLPMAMKMKTTTEAATNDGDDEGGVHSESCSYQIDIDALRTQLEDSNKPKPRMIYVIPTHQNPTGCTMSCETRQQLAQLSAQYNILVVADEVYHLLDWRKDSETSGSKKPARMVLYNTGSNSQCVSVSSFTKIFSPGIRCGWIETSSTAIINKLCKHGYIRSGGACQPFVGALMYTALKEGITDRVLSNLIQSYRHKCQLLCETLRLEAKDTTSEGAEDGEPLLQLMEPCGGYFVWVQLPVNSQDFLEFCSSQCREDEEDANDTNDGVHQQQHPRLQFLPGHRCDYLPPKDEVDEERQLYLDISRSVRLCFAYMDDEDLVDGAKYFVVSLREYMNNSMEGKEEEKKVLLN